MESKTEIIDLGAGLIMVFTHVPDGYAVKNLTLEHHRVIHIGRLKSFNRIKSISFMKEYAWCLVKEYTDQLKDKGWDFEKFPNPVAFFAIYEPTDCENTKTNQPT